MLHLRPGKEDRELIANRPLFPIKTAVCFTQKGERSMFAKCFSISCIAALLFPAVSQSQAAQSNAAASACPVEILSLDAAGVSAHIKNTSGKTIVGLVFNAAIADATEHWRWFHWDFDDSRPLRDFGWNKAIKTGATKRLTWGWGTYLDFQHIGGGAFVLTSVLFDDSSRWEQSDGGNSCEYLWYKHKKTAFRPVELPPRYGD